MENTKENLIKLFKAMAQTRENNMKYFESMGNKETAVGLVHEVLTLETVIDVLEDDSLFNDYYEFYKEDIEGK